MRRLGCLTPLGILSGVIAVLAITGAALATGGMMFNPGPLNAVGRDGLRLGGVTSHAEIGGRCSACHTPPWGGEKMEQRCLACHTNIQSQITDPNTLHGALPEGLQCRTCHSEHKGPQATLTRMDFQAFPHQVLGFSLATHQMTSAGQPFACADCHVQDLAHFDRTLCETCHRTYQADFITTHIASLSNDCMACHDGTDRFSKSVFNHSAFAFSLSGKHNDIQCTQCHTNVHVLADFKNASHQCVDCHRQDDTHKGELGTDCAKCHTPDDWKQIHFDHNQSVFKLMGKHVDVECTQCHINNVFKGIPQQCADCHTGDDPHKGALGSDCAKCHMPDDWKKTTFDHAQSIFRLTGLHTSVTCDKCHADQTFKGAPQGCADCHGKDDPHNGALGADCAKCHTSDGWKPTTFDHSQSTFKLVGLHVNVTCDKCHTDKIFKGTSPVCMDCHRQDDPHQGALGECARCHTPTGWKPTTFDHNQSAFKLLGQHINTACARCHTDQRFKGTPQSCIDCHRTDDAHQGVLSSQCAQCHTPIGWKPSTFNHSQSTFKLVGQHANTACARCHADKLFKGTPQECINCHRQDDAHNGQFGANCAQCHSPQGWKPATFDHNRATFKLTGAHVTVACTRCHVNGVFKGTSQNCVDCHRKDDAHNGQFGANCAQCHTTDDWKKVTFDHNRAAFKLTGAHVTVACTLCHANGVFNGTPQNCVDCHRGKDAHHGTLGATCAQCHSTSAWKPSTFNHSQAPFKLVGAHANVACARCHTSNDFKNAPQNCVDCHRTKDAHNGALGANCAQCHSPQGWKPSTFNHSQAPFKLTGAHVNVTCARCHTSSDFKNTPQGCVDCHRSKDAHKGALGANCAQCHSTSAWKPSTFDHNRAPFKLTGVHVNVACARCHTNNDFKNTPQTCVSCHAEPAVHKGQFGTNCAQCHNTNTWQGATFRHTFPLNHGGKGTIPCATCHTTPGNFRAYTCYGCHNQAETEKHHLEKRITNIANCVQCHPTGRGD